MEAPIELAEQLYAAALEDDPAPFLARCAPDAVIVYPGEGLLPYGGQWRGRSEIEAFLSAHDEAEEIVSFDVIDMLESGEAVTVVGRFEGRAKPGSATWSSRFVHLLTFRGGLLERWEAFFDTAAALDAHARSSPGRNALLGAEEAATEVPESELPTRPRSRRTQGARRAGRQGGSPPTA
jgi:hypothetical protein